MLELVKNTLREDDRLTADGKLLRNKIMELTHKQDEELIELLMSKKKIKDHFFTEVNGTLVFNQDEFINFVNNKQFLPDSYTTFKNRIGLTSDGEYLDRKKDIALAWPYKDCVLEGDQADPDEDRDEIFWNETLAPDEVDRLLDPKALTNFKRVDEEGEHKDSELRSDDNLLIRGNNLLCLHSLKKRFRESVKMVYIDPPFNTENDSFNYNDMFDHSTWLTFMKNRLEMVKELLQEDGVIFLHIDQREQAYLRVLADEVFGRENFLNQITWQRTPEITFLGQGQTSVNTITEQIIIYRKNDGASPLFDVKKKIAMPEKMMEQYRLYIELGQSQVIEEYEDENGNPVKIIKFDDYNYERLSSDIEKSDYIDKFDKIYQSVAVNKDSTKQQKFLKKFKNEVVYAVERTPTRGKNAGQKIRNLYLNGRQLWPATKSGMAESGEIYREVDMSNLWLNKEISATGIADEGKVTLKRGKKPEKLLKRVIKLGSREGDLVLDFFLGSGTTAAVAHKMNRKYIGIEQLDYSENDSTVRLKNVIDGDQTGISEEVDWEGRGSFVYCELMKWNQKYVDEIEKAESSKELLEIWKRMKEESFLSYKLKPQKFDENVSEFKELSLKNQKKFLMECLDKNHLYVNLSEIEDKEYDISEEDKKMNKQFYGGL